MNSASVTPVLAPTGHRVERTLEVLRIEPGVRGIGSVFSEIWEFRELLMILVWRDVTIRYKQTIVGVAWVVFQPLVMMFIFNLFLRGVLPSDGQPYFLFVFAGLMVWQLFSRALSTVAISLKENEYILKKAYIPRILFVVTAMGSVVVEFVISLIVLLTM